MRSFKKLVEYAHLGYASRNWYGEARFSIHAQCLARRWDSERFINILALTSPRVSVKKNWGLAAAYMATGSVKGMLPNVIVSLRHYEETSEIKGRKTEAFARALRGDTTALVLDVWMARALGVEERKVTSKANMARALRLVKRVAAVLGLNVRDCQAAIWAGACIRAGRTPTAFGIG